MVYLRYYGANLLTAIGIAGFLLGGAYVWLGAATILGVLLGDLLLGRDEQPRTAEPSVLTDLPLYLHVLLTVGLYVAMAWRVGQGLGGHSTLELVAILAGAALSLGWLSAIPNVPVAHELGHRHGALAQFLADLLAVFFGDPSRWVSHNLGHHIKVSTADDSDTPRRGETVYRFVWRATTGALHEALTAERTRLERSGRGKWSLHHRLLRGILMAGAVAIPLVALGGLGALALGVAGVVVAKVITEGLNYLQHYGLIRVPGMPVEDRHAWNHLWTVTRAVAVEITTHSQHHQDSDVTFTRLQPRPTAPQMPGAALCFLMAFVPPLWERYIAKPRLRDWDLHHANAAEQALAREANRRAGWPDWLASN
jgi:alkane 1-monooxygenase